jgi:hypothetical protein
MPEKKKPFLITMKRFASSRAGVLTYCRLHFFVLGWDSSSEKFAPLAVNP